MTNKVTTVRFHIGGDDEIKTEHNRREESTVKWEPHIDMEGKREVLRDMSIEETYEELFGRAIEEYDAKQKRRDRRIGGVHEYMEQVRADSRGRVNHKTRTKGKNLAYEVIVGVGSVKPEFDETTGRMKRDKDGNILTPFLVPDDICEAVLKNYLAAWDTRNPHLRLYGAYLHGDEGGAMHMHLDFVPWADGYTRGMSVQTSLSKALSQQGCKSEGWTRNSHVVWAERERNFIESILEEQYGYTVIHPDAGKYKESIPWRVYAAEQEALKRLDDQNVKLDAMRHEAEQMENELEAKRKELEETSEATSVVEEMKNTIMPDGRSMWEHNLARIRAERERKMREEEESKRKRKNASTTRRLPRYLSEEARAQIDEQEERIARQVRENANAGRSERLQRKTLDMESHIEANSGEEAEIDLQSIHR